jgi:hypothetical protein
MKSILKLGLPLCLLLAALIELAKIGILPTGTPFDYFRPEACYAREWRDKLQAAKSAESALSAVQENIEGGELVRLSDGTWVAVVMEHACCTGAGFNATLYVTSAGRAYLDSDSCYCGFTELGEELSASDKKSIEAFLTSIKSGGKHITEL